MYLQYIKYNIRFTASHLRKATVLKKRIYQIIARNTWWTNLMANKSIVRWARARLKCRVYTTIKGKYAWESRVDWKSWHQRLIILKWTLKLWKLVAVTTKMWIASPILSESRRLIIKFHFDFHSISDYAQIVVTFFKHQPVKHQLISF